MIFRSIFGGSKSPILSLKTSFGKNAKKTYFGSEKNSKTDQKNRFSGKFTNGLNLQGKSKNHKSDDF